MKHGIFGVALAVVLAGVAGCDQVSDDGNGGSLGRPSGDGGDATGDLPGALVGSWFAGRGGTSAPYDPDTGTWGAPNGTGMTFVFRADGSYTQATQGSASNLGCTSAWIAFEEGTATAEGERLFLHPTRGHRQYTDTCAPGLDSDDPIDVEDQAFTWSVGPYSVDASLAGLTVQRESDGASAEFRKLGDR
jgi:hypothetical protein